LGKGYAYKKNDRKLSTKSKREGGIRTHGTDNRTPDFEFYLKSCVLLLINNIVQRQPIRFALFYVILYGVILNMDTFWSRQIKSKRIL